MRRLIVAMILLGAISSTARAGVPYDDRSIAGKALLNVVAGLANVVPVLPAFWAKPCLPGYVLCKATFAFASVLFAGEQVLFSGAGDMNQANAILSRGFGGDWFLTARHVNGDAQASPWPEATAASPPTP